MDMRFLWGVAVAAVVAIAVILGGRAYLSEPDPESEPAPMAQAPTVAPSAPSGPAGTGTGTGTGTGSAALDRTVQAARETLANARPDSGPDPAPDLDPSLAPGDSGPAAALPAPSVEASGAPADPDAPTFDIVRVEPDGSAVLAGRAAPGATVSILDGGTSIGETTADGRGEWVFLPESPLAPGARELSLSARGGQTSSSAPPVPVTGAGALPPGAVRVTAGGAGADDVRMSPTVVILSVPGRDAGGAPNGETPDAASVIALEAPRVGGGAGRLLQGPAPQVVQGALQVGRVDYSSSGALALTGTASPGAVVQLYMDNAPVARVEADASGTWVARPGTEELVEKLYVLRVDQVGPDGEVEQRVELPFQHTDFTFARGKTGETLLVVQPGNSLWRVARAVYGQGTDYTVIFQANAEHIRDPDLIYPGQVFVIPAKGTPQGVVSQAD